MSFSAGQFASLAGSFQRNAEAFSPAVLVFLNADPITVSRGDWQSASEFQESTDQQIEVRTCALRVRKAALIAAGYTALTAGRATATLDGITVTLTAQTAGHPADVAFHFTARAIGSETAAA